MKKIPLYLQILIALVLGILAGTFLPETTKYYSWVGTLFMNALCLLIVPIIFLSVSLSVVEIGSGGQGGLKRIGAKTVFWYVATMLLAVLKLRYSVPSSKPVRQVPTVPCEL